MQKHSYIRSFSAILMMLVMAFSITPKRTVHQIFGCHDSKTTSYKHHTGKETSFNNDGFHCACEQQEFQTPFLSSVPQVLYAPAVVHSNPTNVIPIPSYHSVSVVLQPLRGPPAIV